MPGDARAIRPSPLDIRHPSLDAERAHAGVARYVDVVLHSRVETVCDLLGRRGFLLFEGPGAKCLDTICQWEFFGG